MATNKSFKLPTEYKIMISSSPRDKRHIVKKLFVEALSLYEQSKNRKFSDPAVAQKGGRPKPGEKK